LFFVLLTTHPAEYLIHNTNFGMLSGHKGADLSQNGDQSILTEKGALPAILGLNFVSIGWQIYSF
jgi:hypothetical protein